MLKNEDIESVVFTSATPYRVNWIMTSWCNFRCPYCIQGTEHTAWIAESIKLNQARNLNKLLKLNNISGIDLKLVGGEVTYYDLIKILSEIDSISQVSMITNFSRELSYFKDLYNYCRSRGIHVHLIASKHSQNIEYVDKMIEFTDWCRLNSFPEPQVSVVVSDNYDTSELERLWNSGVTNISLKAQRQEACELLSNAVSNNTFDIIKAFYEKHPQTKKKSSSYCVTLKNGEQLRYRDNKSLLNDIDQSGLIPDGYYCDYRNHLLRISASGLIYEANCEPIGSKNKPLLGNLNETWDIKLPTGWIYCDYSKSNSPKRCILCNKQTLRRSKPEEECICK